MRNTIPRHFETLIGLINGIISKGHVSLTKVAETMPNNNKNDSNETNLGSVGYAHLLSQA